MSELGGPAAAPPPFRWVEHDPTFASLMLGRIEVGQVSKSNCSDIWFGTRRFCQGFERASFSMPTADEARAECEAHARKVVLLDQISPSAAKIPVDVSA